MHIWVSRRLGRGGGGMLKASLVVIAGCGMFRISRCWPLCFHRASALPHQRDRFVEA